MQPDRNKNLSPRAQRGEELNQKLGGTVFIVAIGAGMLFVARHLWNNRDGLTEILDGAEPPRE